MRRAPSVTLAASCARPAVFKNSSLICARFVVTAAGESAAVAKAEAEAESCWVHTNQRKIFLNAESPSEALPSVCAANGCGGGFCT